MHSSEWIDTAFKAEVPTAEKLVLVYLASRVNAVGLGYWDRDELERLTGYKRRSVQRLLKSLRDAGQLRDVGERWYTLDTAIEADVAGLPEHVPQHGGPPMTLAEVARAEGDSVLDREELESVGEAVAGHIGDATGELVDQLTAFEARLGHLLGRAQLAIGDRLDQFTAALPNLVHAPAPPDPVREDPVFKQLIDAGTDDAEAYLVVQALLERRAHTPNRDKPAPRQTAPNGSGDAIAPTRYDDTAEGRFLRVRDILEPDDAGKPAALSPLTRWRDLELGESKHTVEGEVDAFLLLYPAIIEAARRYTGTISVHEFLDPQAIAQGRAPWDRDPEAARAEDPGLNAELATMLAELERCHDPRCTVQPRTVEKGDDGVTRTETLLAYYRRVKAKHSEMLKLKDMGVL